MIKLLNGAAAFLLRDGEYLLMKRAPGKAIAPGVWSGVGGKLEQWELNDPRAACLREVEEETGIPPAHIFDLGLRYVIVRRSRDTIRQTYVYFGSTDMDPTVATDEGELHWIPAGELLDRTYTQTFAHMLRHFVERPDAGRVIVGVAGNEDGACRMSWTAVEDFDGNE